MNLEKQMKEHLEGYPQREKDRIAFREGVDVFHAVAAKRFDKIDSHLEEVKKLAAHQDPSAKTLIMFDVLKEEIRKITDMLDEMHDKILENADKRYAIKLVERVVFGMIALILTGFVLALIRDIIK